MATSGIATSSTGTVYLVGSSSGLDTSALVEAAVATKRLPADTLETKVSEKEAEITAYQEMQGLLEGVADSLYPLSNPLGSFAEEDNVFAQNAAYLSSSDVSDPSSVLGVSVDSDAPHGVYDITVEQIATTHKIASAEQSDKDTALGLDGVFALTTASGSSEEITVSADMTLSELADAINLVTDSTGVRATLLQVSDGSYQLVLSGEETGEEIELTEVSGDSVLQSLGIIAADGSVSQELQAAQPAIFTFDGLSVTRTSNSVDDLIDGVTIDLYAAEPGASIALEIGTDLSAVKEQVVAFVDAYNAYREFAMTHQELSESGDASADATLFGDSILRGANAALYDGLTATLGADDDLDSLDDLGITFNDDNTLSLDESALDDALLYDLEAVQSLFEFQMDSSSANVSLLDGGAAHSGLSFDLAVTTDGTYGGITDVTVDGQSGLFTISGSRLVGVEGTAYEGLELVYTGNETSETISLSFNQGFASALYESADSYASSSDGILAQTIEALQEEVEDYSEEISEIDSRVADYEEGLIETYAEMESQIAESNTLLEQIKAVLGSDDD